eukprot:s223_g35.t1
MVRSQSRTEQAQRKAQRSRQTLKDRMVSSGMLDRYRKAASSFVTFAKDFNLHVSAWEDLDEVTSQWLEHIFHDGQHKSLASDGLAGLQHFMPQALGRLKHSWKLARVWQKLGFLAEAAALLVGFDTMLRSGELYEMKIKDISFYGGRAVLSLGYTKTGKRNNAIEMAVVESKLAVASLRKACVGRSRNEFLLSRGARVFRSLFNALVELFQLEGLITVYSLRRGGASWDFLQHQSMERTLLRGRKGVSTVSLLMKGPWRSRRIARIRSLYLCSLICLCVASQGFCAAPNRLHAESTTRIVRMAEPSDQVQKEVNVQAEEETSETEDVEQELTRASVPLSQRLRERLATTIAEQEKQVEAVPTEAQKQIVQEEVDLNGVDPIACVLGAAPVAALSYGFWTFTQRAAEWFLSHPVETDFYPAQRLGLVFQAAVVGLSSLAAGIFGFTGLGILLLGIRVGFGVLTGELDPNDKSRATGKRSTAETVLDVFTKDPVQVVREEKERKMRDQSRKQPAQDIK